MTEPNLLFISPVFPGVSGNGLAMRAGSLVEALAQQYRVHLLVIPIQDVPTARLDPNVAKWCVQHEVVRPPRLPHLGPPALPKPPEWRSLSRSFLERASDTFGDVDFSMIYAFRLCVSPIAVYMKRTIARGAKTVLDLDEVESETRLSLADLYQASGQEGTAVRTTRDAQIYATLEQYYVPSFDQVVLCSQVEADALTSRYKAKSVAVFPNSVRTLCEAPDAVPSESRTLLFVGNANYFPNHDAVEFFATGILARVRSLADGPVRFDVVGLDDSSFAASWPDCRLLGRVPSVTGHYREASVVVVPLRAGGGTRIKILEAFQHGRPVVSTTKGAEGLDVEPDTHLLIADEPSEFAECCARLMRDRELVASMTARARDLVETRYSQARVNDVVLTDLVEL